MTEPNFEFHHPWYTGRLQQDIANLPDGGQHAIAQAILCGSAYLAQSIDNAVGAGRTENSLAEGVDKVRAALVNGVAALETLGLLLQDLKE